jgi:hypothetical protein
MTPIAIASAEHWMREVVRAAEEIVTVLRLGELRVVGTIPLPSDLPGAYLPIVGARGASVYVGWLASNSGCEALAHAFVGDVSLGTPSHAEVVDAMGEIVNIVAGAVKRRMLAQDPTLLLGLPIYATSPIRPVTGRALATQITCGSIGGVLVLIGNEGLGGRVSDSDPHSHGNDV